ncbi:EAL domain-containing protein [Cohnella hashimotonis]|uniref:EAL domain-containing protein n=1 Tax=Cohnella hashimotonis TaxID=2826895 RepID=A0ABT6TP21_9BACL|nr:EAL domain-containing protein [Cohnella hashimotonis]MDI4648479.1 EAL domain-containing protein [Cohnella hashimotonis]
MIELQSSYNATMVVLSCFVASIAAYTGLSMSLQYAAASKGRSRLAWLACGIAVMGAGIWAVCFYEINAYKWSTGVNYDYGTVILTLAIAGAAAALVLRAVGEPKLRKRTLVLRGGIAGVCAAVLPYAGLQAMRASLHPRFEAGTFAWFALVVAAVFIVVLWIAYKFQTSRGPKRKAIAGLLLGTAFTASIHIGLALVSWTSPDEIPSAVQSDSSAMISFFLGFATLFVIGIAFAAIFMERFWKAQMRRQLERDMRIESLFRHSQDAVFSYNLEGKLLDANLAAFRLTGYEWDALSKLRLRDMISPEYQHTVSVNFQHTVAGQSRNFDCALIHRGGRRLEVNNTNVPVLVEGKVVGVYTIVRDITERKQAEWQMNHMAHHDELTGLPNRRLFEQQLVKAIADQQQDGQSAAVLFLDIDRFKLVNDSQGHDVGDLLLRSVADRLSEAVKHAGIVARLGGDEFSVLLTGGISREDAQTIAARINRELDIPFSLRGKDVHITASIGIALFPEDGDSLISLMKNADTAMYSAKENGKNTFNFYDLSMNDSLFERVQLENELRKALDRGEFFLVYQPQVELASGKVVGVEALIRWQHSTKGLISPAEFIPLAEETGMIVPIGEWALRTACTLARRWSHSEVGPLRMSVNLSSRQFVSPDFAESVERVVRETGMPPELLDLEITESMTMDVNRSIETLRQLKTLGVSISIDDFGTGYSSLSYLKSFPVDRLKIDQSFVRQMHSETKDRSIVATIIALAHNLNLQVVAEGVETLSQSEFLAQQGCDEMQGYYISKPLKAFDVEDFILNKSAV